MIDLLIPNLKKYFDAEKNLLVLSLHGVGKSLTFMDFAREYNIDMAYLSAATMDPYTDFVGIPHSRRICPECGFKWGPDRIRCEFDNTLLTHEDLYNVRPQNINNAELLVVDEINRCLTADTLISLVSGESVAIRDLVGRDHFYVYSYDQNSRRVVVGRGHSARLTQEDAPIYEVTIDNGSKIRCTGNHPFLLSSGEYKRADELATNDSLMPLYRIYHRSPVGYEYVFQPKFGSRWDLTYHLADEYNLNMGVYEKSDGSHRHHIDFNANNNSPENIMRVNQSDHSIIHAHSDDRCSIGGQMAHELHPDLVARTIHRPDAREKAIANSVNTRRTSVEYSELRSYLVQQYWSDPTRREVQAERAREQWLAGNFDNIDRAQASVKNIITKAFNALMRLEILPHEITMEHYEDIRSRYRNEVGISMHKLSTVLKYFSDLEDMQAQYDEYRTATTVGNHKVLKIEKAGYEDVYDISVDEYHNFALANGIFVHNSPPKVLNAIMELVQFRSINGERLPRLKAVFAGMNPPDSGQYAVEDLDPALVDRFDIFYELKPAPSIDYIVEKTGISKKHAQAFIAWWHGHDQARTEPKNFISPRRLEKMCSAFVLLGDFDPALPNWMDIDKSRLRRLLRQADNDADIFGGNIKEGAYTGFTYDDQWIKDHSKAVVAYLKRHSDDQPTSISIAGAIKSKRGETLASAPWIDILNGLHEGILESFIELMSDGKREKFFAGVNSYVSALPGTLDTLERAVKNFEANLSDEALVPAES